MLNFLPITVKVKLKVAAMQTQNEHKSLITYIFRGGAPPTAQTRQYKFGVIWPKCD